MHPSRIVKQSGFALTEVLVATLLLGVATVAITGLAIVGTRSSFESERQTVALAIVNEKVENVRALPYGDVGLTDANENEGEPDGVLLREESVTRNQQAYVVETDVFLVDDPLNGTVPEGTLTEDTADYKNVEMRVRWNTVSGNSRVITPVITYIAPSELRCEPGAQGVCPAAAAPAGEGACIPGGSGGSGGSNGSEGLSSPTPTSTSTASPSPSVECSVNADCAGGLVCSSSQECVQCNSDADCGSGQSCDLENNQCVAQCDADGSCPQGSTCNTATNICDALANPSPTPAPQACTTDAECTGGYTCDTDASVCVLQCDGSNSCPSGYSCNTSTNTCDASSSPYVGADCPASGVCPAPSGSSSGSCPPGAQFCSECYANSDCSTGEICNVSGQCEASAGACSSNSDCSAGESCVSGACTASCATTGCGAGSICNESTGVCTLPCTGESGTCSCPTGESCNPDSGVCEPDPTPTPTTTPTPPPCTDDAQCSDGQVCDPDAGGCVSTCENDSSCSENTTCQPVVGRGSVSTCQPPEFDSCTDDAQCGEGQACIDGLCQGDWCLSGADVSVECAAAEPIIRQCFCPNIFGGGFSTYFQEQTQEQDDPACAAPTVGVCQPIQVWESCADVCGSPTPTPIPERPCDPNDAPPINLSIYASGDNSCGEDSGGYFYTYTLADVGGNTSEECIYEYTFNWSAVVEGHDSGYDIATVYTSEGEYLVVQGKDLNMRCTMVSDSGTLTVQARGQSNIYLDFDTVDGRYHEGAYVDLNGNAAAAVAEVPPGGDEGGDGDPPASCHDFGGDAYCQDAGQGLCSFPPGDGPFGNGCGF